MDTIQLIGLIMIFFGFIYLILRGMGKISDNDFGYSNYGFQSERKTPEL